MQSEECTHETTVAYRAGENRTVKVCLDCGLIKIVVDGETFETYHAAPIVLGYLRRRFLTIEKFFKLLGRFR